jgi:ribosome maturation factor RimP
MNQAGLETLIAPILDRLGYALVRLHLAGGSSRSTLQVMAERVDNRNMTLEDCETISRAVSEKLDIEDPIAAAYTLEVSSPGIDRPLLRPADYQRFSGHVAKIETRTPVAGRRRISGRIASVNDSHVRLAVEDDGSGEAGELEVAFADIAKAKLKLTDELIAAVTRH